MAQNLFCALLARLSAIDRFAVVLSIDRFAVMLSIDRFAVMPSIDRFAVMPSIAIFIIHFASGILQLPPVLHYNLVSMGRRKRKPKPARDAKPAPQVTVHAEPPTLAKPPETQIETKNSETSIELQNEIENLATMVEVQEARTEPEAPPSPVETSVGGAFPAPSSSAPVGADRRAHPRYAFTAVAEVVAGESGARGNTRVRDLSQQGCFLDTDSPLALGTATDVRIAKGATSFQAQARVVYNQPGKGMGLMFTAMHSAHREILDSWIAESRETSWLAANRRRSQRVLMKIPVRVSVQAGAASLSEEETHTLAISAHGALIAVSAPHYRGQRLTLSNIQTKGALECVVAHVDKFPGEQMKVGVEFLLPNPTFWRVAFPPKDWSPRHPDAKSRMKG